MPSLVDRLGRLGEQDHLLGEPDHNVLKRGQPLLDCIRHRYLPATLCAGSTTLRQGLPEDPTAMTLRTRYDKNMCVIAVALLTAVGAGCSASAPAAPLTILSTTTSTQPTTTSSAPHAAPSTTAPLPTTTTSVAPPVTVIVNVSIPPTPTTTISTHCILDQMADKVAGRPPRSR